jgi:putative ABC transport system permease protein
MVGPRTLLLFYRRHLRVQPLRELMAVMGVAAGVALLFTVQIANRSITGSFEQIVHGLAGRATLEVAARGPEGFNERIAEQVARTPGVLASAPMLEDRVVVAGRKGRRALVLVGADQELVALGSKLVSRFAAFAAQSLHGLLVLTEPTADAIAARAGSRVALQIAGRTHHIAVAGAIPSSEIGPLAESPIAATALPILQQLAGAPHRVTRVLIQPRSGEQAVALAALKQRFGATLNVRPIDREAQLLAEAARPEGQLTALFSLIALLVGMILAYNSLLLASGERRAFIAHLTQLGARDSAIVASLLFDALIMGLAGCLIGLVLGDAISLLAYRAIPGYLSAAFPIGSQRVITAQTVLIAMGAGLLAAFTAAALPAFGLLRASASTGEPSASRWLSLASKPRWADKATFLIGAALLLTALILALADPALSVAGLIALVAGLVLSTPLTVQRLLRLARSASKRSNDPTARLSTAELRSSPTRSVALVATGMIAVFLMVTIGGSVADVKRAVRAGAGDTLAGAQLWVRTGGPSNVYDTQPFPATEAQQRLARLGVVRSVLPYRESFLDLPTRRTWIIGVPPQTANPIAASQILEGSPTTAAHHLRERGWAVISRTIANEKHLRLGQQFSLPTPSGPVSLRLAATISNYGWLPGTILLNGEEYSHLWQTDRASQLAVTLRAGVPVAQGRLAIQHALPSNSALTVQTAQERQAQVSSVLGSTLARLQQTSTVVLIVAIMTVVAMMVSAVWQRRGRLDALISIGMSPGQLARLVFYESGCVLLGGCLIGMAAGLLGQRLVDTWLQNSTGSPIQFAAAWQLGLRTILIASVVSVLTATLAVMRTVRFQPTAAFSTD